MERTKKKPRRGETPPDVADAGAAELIPAAELLKQRDTPPEADRLCVVVGMVSIKEDEDFGITGAQLFGDDGELYNIVFDRNGVALSDEMDQMRAEVTGTVASKANGKWLSVESYRELDGET